MRRARITAMLWVLPSLVLAQTGKTPASDPFAHAEFKTRTYEVGPGFLKSLRDMSGAPTTAYKPADPPAPGADPFAQPPAAAPPISETGPRKSTRAMLEHIGIPFPTGATAFFDPVNHRLHVRHTESALNVVAAVLESQANTVAQDVSFTLHVIEAPGVELRSLLGQKINHGESLERLLNSESRVVETASVLTRSGQRALLETGIDQSIVADIPLDAKGAATFAPTQRLSGLRFEVDPVISRRSFETLIDANLSVQLTPLTLPATEVTIREPVTGTPLTISTASDDGGRVMTATTFRNKETRLIAIWKPQEQTDADLLQGVFVTAHLVRPRPVSRPWGKPLEVDVTRSRQIIRHTFELPYVIWYGGYPPDINKYLTQQRIVLPKDCKVENKSPTQLQVQADLETLEIILHWVAESWEKQSKNLGLTTHIVRGPGRMLRSWLRQSADVNDHATVLTDALAAAARGEVSFAATSHVQGKSEQRIALDAALQRSVLSEVRWHGAERPDLTTESRSLGLVLEMDPVIAEDGHLIDLPLALTCHPAAATTRRQPLTDPASGIAFELPLEDIPQVRLQTGLLLAAGGTRIVAAWHPRGDAAFEKAETLELLFVTAEAVRNRVQNFTPTLPPSNSAPEDPQAMVTRTYRVPPDFLLGQNITNAAKSKKSWSDQARELVEAQGITFPKGSSLVYAGTTLIMVNTLANQDIMEMYTWGCSLMPKSMSFTLHIMEAPAPLIRDLLRGLGDRADHTPELRQLLKATEAGQVKPLTTLNTQTKSGQRATVANTRGYPNVIRIGLDAKGLPEIKRETRSMGNRMEIDPVMGADGDTLDVIVTPEFSPAAPMIRPERLTAADAVHTIEIPLTDFHVEKLETGLTMSSGTARIVGVWKPTGKAEFGERDVLHIAVLEAAIVKEDGK